MNRKKIIKYIIVIITSIIILSVFIMFKNKKIYITKVDELDNIKISMLKLEDGVTTVIKQVPTIGDWIMTYDCDDTTVKIYWDEVDRKLHMKNIKPTACIIKFEKSLSAVNVVSIYVDDVYVGELDTNKTYDLVSYECANDETVTWNIIDNGIYVKPLTKNTNCKLYFKEIMFLYNKILLFNTAQSDISVNFDTIVGDGFYYTNDSATYGEDGTKIYYFRGRVENNWVSFAGYLWRIVRTTSEGGVRLVYSGDGSAATSGIISSAEFNSSYTNKYYVGYTHNTSGYTGTQTDSTIKIEIDNWYNANLSSYSSYLSTTAVYCADRSSERVDGSNIYFPAYDRIMTNKRPSYACSSTNSSRYTISTETGNGYLTKPIALLTADEINYAGVTNSTSSLNSYMLDNATTTSWWTMSPSYYNGSYAYEWYQSSSNYLNSNLLYTARGVRPVISLKSDTIVASGNGSKETPYVIE